jgi:hypothetical protein
MLQEMPMVETANTSLLQVIAFAGWHMIESVVNYGQKVTLRGNSLKNRSTVLRYINDDDDDMPLLC